VAHYVEGKSLADMLHRYSPLAATTAVSIARELAELLGYVAERGIVRLDLKPSNIVVRDELHPVVTGLGLARCM
jgi:serine/threonine protein kinase